MRGLSRDEKIRELQRGALRKYGRKYAFWILAGPFIVKVLLWAGVLALAYVTWVKVPHAVLGVGALTVAGVAALALVRPKLSAVGSRRRMLHNATGAAMPQVRLGWAYVTLLVAGAGMGYLALWSPLS